MARKETQETQEAFAERGKKWGDYFRDLVRKWQYADETGGRIFISRVELARLIGVSDVTIGYWTDGKRPPSRQHGMQVANAFNAPLHAIWEAAGINPLQDDSYNTANEILEAIAKAGDLSQEEKNRLQEALLLTLSPDWIRDNPDWIELVRFVFNQKLPLVTKAQRIASIIDGWKQENKN